MESWVGREAEAGEEVRERAVSVTRGQTVRRVREFCSAGCGGWESMNGYFRRDIWRLGGSPM